MSISVEEKKCAACQAYLFDDDDIVFCPVCGAPHHRDCYNAIGHCALEGDHGTEKQYDLTEAKQKESKLDEGEKACATEQKVRCPRCGTELHESEDICPMCHTPKSGVKFVSVSPFGVHTAQGGSRFDGETVIEDDIKLKELVPIVSVNSARYSEKFVALNRKNRISWNWAAFLTPSGWSFYRKNFRTGMLYLLLVIAGSLLSLPLEAALNSLSYGAAGGMTEMTAALAQLLKDGNLLPCILSAIGGILTLGTRVFAGLFADYSYRGECIEKAKKIRASQEEKETLYYKLGGVSPVWFMLALMAETYAPALISALF